MADFVAVIRRTVDGLSDNVPEMRARVYEKARGAVRRQLESMKPRPSDEMIERQMVKLESAITEVESDHAEALPEIEEQQTNFAPETVYEEPAEAVYDEPVSAPAETAAVEEEAPPVAETAAEVEEEQSHGEQPIVAEETHDSPVWQAPADVEPVAHVEATPETGAEAPEAFEPDAPAEEEAVVYEAVAYDEPPAMVEEALPEPVEPAPEPEPIDEPVWQQPEPVENIQAFEAPAQEEAGSFEPSVEPSLYDIYPPEPVDPEPVVEQLDVEEKPEPPTSEWELPEWSESDPATTRSEPVATTAVEGEATADEIPDLRDYEPVETVTPLNVDADNEASDGAEPSQSWVLDDSDPFARSPASVPAEGSEPAISDWSWPVDKQAAPAGEEKARSADDWSDVDALLEHGDAAGATLGKEAAAEDLSVPPSRPMSYRAEPKRSRFTLKRVGLAALLLIAAGGAGYGYWQNQATVNSWVAETIASLTAEVPVEPSPDASVPANGAESVTTPDTSSATQTPATTDVASLGADSSKFTQRLQADGSEVDQGPAAAPAGEAAAEGKSVAAQTEAGKPDDPATATTADQTADAGTDTQPVQPVPAQQTATDPATQQIPAGAQKMFLYEERLGQSAPTAIEGNVAWSLKEESPGADAKPEPVIQAQINVPERGLTALMTVKRNVDTSLPASHVIEFVFSLPENFEGGSIESVQRVAMKRNEQDRGDPLIAVPAKITDDFHMIALNDFQEAVATNTELLRNRNWIDIPLTYRNGRRALLTLEKGPAGTDAFTKAMQAWSLAAKPSPAVQ